MSHDIVIVGGGPGGYATAFRAAARGLDVAVIEADRVGGTCLHRGCIPSKALLHVANVLHEVQRDDLGIDGDVGLDLDSVRTYRDRVINTLFTGLEGLFRSRSVTLYRGMGRVLEPGVVEVSDATEGTERVEGDSIVIATGSIPRELPKAATDGQVILSSSHALALHRLPNRAVIVGAGAVGVEFATIWRSMGADVTLVEALDRILPLEDVDSSAIIQRSFARSGIDIWTGARVAGITVADGFARVVVERGQEVDELEADTVLIAIGRRPNLDAVGARELGIVDDRGFATVDERCRTEVSGIWAIGDVTPGLQLAHSATAEGFQIADTIAGLDPQPVDYAQIPRVTYCRPEVASVGLTERDATDRYPDVQSTIYPLRSNAKGIISGSEGQVKIVHRGPAAPTLGVHIVSPHATDLIAEATLTTVWGAHPSEVASIVHPHPTLSETVGEAFLAASGLPFHGH